MVTAEVDVDGLKVAIAHDYLTQRGGAERVVVALLEVFPAARVITSVYDPDATFPEFRGRSVETTRLDRVPAFRTDPRRALPLLPQAFAGYALHNVDVVLCSSSGFAHGIGGGAPKVVYCHNPARWLYQTSDYIKSPVGRSALSLLGWRLRAWDQRAAATATTYLVNSSVVAERVSAAYGRVAQVLPPPVAIDTLAARTPLRGIEPGYLLTVGRPRGYKNTTEVVRAMAALPRERLVVVGGVSADFGDLRNVTDVGRVSDAELRWLYANAGALIAISHEDFGLTPVEAYSFGTPAMVLRAGGYLDTTVPGLTGLFLERPAAPDVVSAVTAWRNGPALSREAIIAHARRWSRQRFAADLKASVAETVGSHARSGRAPVPPPTKPRTLRVVQAERRGRRTTVGLDRRGARHVDFPAGSDARPASP